MYITDRTLDDLLRRVLTRLLKVGPRIASSRGDNAEIAGALLQLTNPLARLSRTEGKGTVYSCVGEILWYLAKRNDLEFIKYYVPPYEEEAVDGVIRGGYGPRLFDWNGINQIENVVELLRRKPWSRRAAVQLFDANDLADKTNVEVPCTCFLQFLVREHGLDMIVSMRSNDAFLGLPHDVFAFTMIQELVAKRLGLKLGVYKHFAASLHLYDEHREKARRYVAEGFQPTVGVAMPPMPDGDQGEWLRIVLDAEHRIRQGERFNANKLKLPDYWADIVRLLQSYAARSKGDGRMLTALKRQMSTPLYNTYIEKRRTKLMTIPTERQYKLGFTGGKAEEAGHVE